MIQPEFGLNWSPRTNGF